MLIDSNARRLETQARNVGCNARRLQRSQAATLAGWIRGLDTQAGYAGWIRRFNMQARYEMVGGASMEASEVASGVVSEFKASLVEVLEDL